MDIRSLRFAVTLAEELHFGRSARRHFIAAQAFGQHIGRLERELGVRLFERTSRRVELTPAGAVFVSRARALLDGFDGLVDARQWGPHRWPAPFVVGVLGFGAADRWPMLRSAVQVQLPGAHWEFRELDLEDQYSALRSGVVDVALVQYAGEVEGIDFVPVHDSPRVAVVPAGSSMADATRLSRADLQDQRWVNVAGTEQVTRAWLGVDLERAGPLVRQPSAIPTAVALTGRVAVHAAAAAAFYPRPDVRFVPTEGPSVRVAVATRASDHGAGPEAFRRAAALVGGASGVL